MHVPHVNPYETVQCQNGIETLVHNYINYGNNNAAWLICIEQTVKKKNSFARTAYVYRRLFMYVCI